MDINATLPRVPYKFKGKNINAPVAFTDNTPLTGNLLKWANRQMVSVLGNVLSSALTRKARDTLEAQALAALPADATDAAKKQAKANITDAQVADAVKAIPDADAQTMFDAIWTGYKPGETRVSGDGQMRDPVESIANNIAKERVKKLLNKQNIKVSTVTPAKMAEFVKQLRDRDPSILEEAKAQYDKDDAEIGLDFSSLGTDTAAAASTEPGASGADTVSGDTGADSVEGTQAPDAPAGEAPASDDTVTQPETSGKGGRAKGAFE